MAQCHRSDIKLKRTADGFSITCLPDFMLFQAPVTGPKVFRKNEPLNLDV